jgi:transcriptional regulator with XRE-family HTH domain
MSTNEQKEICDRLREERLRQKLSLHRLSMITGIAAPDLSNLERGLRPLYPGWRRRIARALKIKVENLV